MSSNRKPRYNRTEWKSIKLSEVTTASMYLNKDKVGTLHQQLILPDKTVLLYNRSAYVSMFSVSAEEEEKYSKLFERSPVFLMSTAEKDVFLNNLIARQEEFCDEMEETMFRATNELDFFASFVPSKTFYIRTFSPSAIDREASRLMFVIEVRKIIYILLKQQRSDIDDEEIKAYINGKFTEERLDNVSMNLNELKEMLEHFDIDKSKITLVPDTMYASSAAFAMPASFAYPSVELKAHVEPYQCLVANHAIFLVFQQVVCNVDWNREVLEDCDPADEKSMMSFHGELVRYLHVLTKEDTMYFSDFIRRNVSSLQVHDNYKKRKESLLLTPFIKLYDCDFNDSISLLFFLSESEHFGFSYKSPPEISNEVLEEAFLPVWKARLLFLIEWNNKFFDMQPDLEGVEDLRNVIRHGIYQMAPILDWKSETDFLDVILGTTPEKQSYVKYLRENRASTVAMPEYHSWLAETTWQDRTYIKRAAKWQLYEKLKKFHGAFMHPAVRQSLEKEKKELEKTVKSREFLRNEKETNAILKKILEFSKSVEKWGLMTETQKKKNKKMNKKAAQEMEQKINEVPPTCKPSTSGTVQKEQEPTPTPPPNGQKESNWCKLCKVARDNCETVKAQLRAISNQNKKLDTKLKDPERDEAEKPRAELETELEEKLKRIQELREQNESLKASKNKLEPRINGLEENVGACRGQIRVGISLNEAKDAHIRVLKQHVSNDVLSGLSERFEDMNL